MPTFAEVGWGDYPGPGLVGPRGAEGHAARGRGEASTPSSQKLFSEPKFIAFLEKQAVVPAPTDPAGFVAFLKEDRKAAETLIKIANTPKAGIQANSARPNRDGQGNAGRTD